MENTDEIIGSLLGERNAKGMELLFDTYYRTLVLWSNSIVNDISQSEDIVQELFVRIWERHLISETVPANLKSYLFTAVRNLSLNASRKYNPLREAENINTRKKGRIETVLVSGKVSFVRGQEEYSLHPGELAEYRGKEGCVSIRQVDVSNYIA